MVKLKQKWEIKRIYISYTQGFEEIDQGVHGWIEWVSVEPTDETVSNYAEADQLAAEGWELVSVVPLLSGYNFARRKLVTLDLVGGGSSVPTGLLMFFKRPLD